MLYSNSCVAEGKMIVELTLSSQWYLLILWSVLRQRTRISLKLVIQLVADSVERRRKTMSGDTIDFDSSPDASRPLAK
jgi:hypothetical protein